MPFTTWTQDSEVLGPVYIDAGVIIASLCSKDARHTNSALALAQILTSEQELILSALTVSECLWAIAKLSYCELNNQKTTAHWNLTVYRKHRETIFESFGDRMTGVGRLIHEFSAAGVPVAVRPADQASLEGASIDAATHMRDLAMASADAVHLALAEQGAQSLLTTDSGFQDAASSSSVAIVYIAP